MNNYYKKDISYSYKKTGVEEQSELFYRMKNGDSAAREEIIKSCLPMVYKIANKFHYNNKHVDLDDLIQQGNIGLINAVDNWDISKGLITTVATHYITNELVDLIKSVKYNIKYKHSITKQAAKDMIKIKRCESTTLDEISKESGLNKKRVSILLGLMESKRVTYDRSIPMSNYDYKKQKYTSNNKCLADLITVVKNNISNETDKAIFLTWLGYINKQDKVRRVSRDLEISTVEISKSIKKTKQSLKQILKEK